MDRADAVRASVDVARFYIASGDPLGALYRLRSAEIEMATLRVALEKSAEGRVARLPAEGAITLAHVALCAGVPRGTARMAFCRGMLGEQIGTGRHGAILVHVSTAAPWILACRASKGL